jgi:hypothetical protein
MVKALLILIFVSLLLVQTSFALWDDCSRLEENCSYPGICGSYIDTNKDNICDHSQEEPVQKIIEQEKTGVIEEARVGSNYYFLQIIIAVTALYLISYFLAKKNKIKLITHRKIWNSVLLASFLVVGILGLLLTINIQYGTSIGERAFELFWHVEAGIIMVLVSLFHVLWHIPYYKNLLKR